MRFSRPGRSRARLAIEPAEPAHRPETRLLGMPLTSVRVGSPRIERDLGRREVELAYRRVFIPSLIVDHTELVLRQHGIAGEEGFGIWAGTLADGDAFVSSLVLPRIEAVTGSYGKITLETTAALLAELDLLDLVPIAQIHSHPERAYLSSVDAERPLVAVAGFLSIIVPSFGFADLSNVSLWRAYEFHGRDQWRELSDPERHQRLIIDPSVLRID